MPQTVGFIGGGNMATAIVAGLVKQEVFKPEKVIVNDRNQWKLDALTEKYGISTTLD